MSIRSLLMSSMGGGGELITPADGSIETNVPPGTFLQRISTSENGYKIIAGGSIDGAYISPDAGVTWSVKLSGFTVIGAVASSADGSKLAIADYNGGYIYTSSNFGNTWVIRDGGPWSYWIGMCSSASGQYLMAVDTINNIIYQSSNYGASWATIDTPESSWDICSSEDRTKIYILNNYYGGNYLTMNKSTNFGVAWTSMPLPTSFYGFDCSADGTKLIGVAIGGYIYTSIDSGNTWLEHPEFGAKSWTKVSLYNNDTAFAACTFDGEILRFSNNIWG